jgi:hypothetical protein
MIPTSESKKQEPPKRLSNLNEGPKIKYQKNSSHWIVLLSTSLSNKNVVQHPAGNVETIVCSKLQIGYKIGNLLGSE